MGDIGIAVAGTGFIGPVHVEALRRLGRRVVGTLGSTPEKSNDAARRLGLAKGYADFAELLADPEVKAVHIATPNKLHHTQAKQAIRAGKHVICEKPLAMTAEQSANLVALADESAKVSAVCYNIRFYPLCVRARDMIRSGELGRVLHVTGSYLQDWLLHETDFNWRVLSAEGGALRAIADIGTHWMDLISFITGANIESVCADLGIAHETRMAPTGSVKTFSSGGDVPREPVTIDTEDFGSVLFRGTSGEAGSMTVSQVAAGRKNCVRFDIACEKGSLSWDSEEPNTLTVGRRDGPNEIVARDPSMPGGGDYPPGHAEGFPDTFKQLFRAIYADIDAREAGEESPSTDYPTFADGHREVMLCEAILQSHRERGWVGV